MTNTTQALFLQVGGKCFPVASFKEASDKFSVVRDAIGNGASETPSPLLTDSTGRVIGHISYNGRIWPGTPQAWRSGLAPLYDNRG